MIVAKLDVTKIDKAKLFRGKNGAMYLDICLMENRSGTDQYGNDWMVVQSVSKEERDAGKRGAILGNGKNIGQPRGEAPRQQQRPAPAATPVAGDGPPESDDVPF